MNDYIKVPFSSTIMHKANCGLYIVGADILSVLIMYYVFKQLVALNQEYLDTMDKNIV